jgi:Zn-dependent protease
MLPRNPLPVPFLLDPQTFALDDVVTFCVSILVAVLVNAEGQYLMASFLGDTRPGAKDRLHFNAFLHLDLLGTLCFFVGGFGWPRKVKIDPEKFRGPRTYNVIARFGGSLGNFLMANIAASAVWLFGTLSVDSRVFEMLAAVNLTQAVYSVLPIPPLAGASILPLLFTDKDNKFLPLLNQVGPFLLLAICLVGRISSWTWISDALDPVVRYFYELIIG